MTRPRPLAFLVSLALLAPAPAAAGDRRLTVLLVDMTPDASASAAARTCVDDLRARLAADYTELARLGEAALRERLGRPEGPFLTWSARTLGPARPRKDGSRFDAVVLVDCRPELDQLDVLVAPAADGTATLQLRGVAPGRRAIAWLAAAVLRRAWAGFSP